jgi:hypothetical protein
MKQLGVSIATAVDYLAGGEQYLHRFDVVAEAAIDVVILPVNIRGDSATNGNSFSTG